MIQKDKRMQQIAINKNIALSVCNNFIKFGWRGSIKIVYSNEQNGWGRHIP